MIGYKDVFPVLAGGALGCLLWSEYEKNSFVTDHTTIKSDKIKAERQFVFLSDLHDKEFGRDNRRLVKAIERIHPDAVLIGGDMMVAHAGCSLDVTLKLVRTLAEKFPVYYANGNHEERLRSEPENYGEMYLTLHKALTQAGVKFLDNSTEEFGDDISITGANLAEKYFKHKFTIPELPEDEMAKYVGRPDESRFNILLFHSPLFFEKCRQWGADLTLSGHFHGGTIRLPGIGGIMTPQYQFFVKECAGRFDRDGKTMLVSRGLGTHSIKIRFRNRPELMWITLAPQES